MGGSDSILESRDKYTSLFLRVVSVAGISMPALTLAYGLLCYFNLVERSPFYTVELNIVITLAIVIAALAQFYTSYTNIFAEKLIFFYVVLFHILGGLFIIYVSGFTNAPTLFWIPLLVVCELYYGKKGVTYSSLGLFAAAFIWISLQPRIELLTVLDSLLFATVVVSLGLFVGMLKQVHSTEHTDLLKSKKIQGRQRGQLESLVNSISEAIISVNTKSIVQTYNAATLNILDTNQSLGGKHLDDVLHLYDQTGAPQKAATLFGSGSSMTRDDLSHRFSDGEEIRLGITVSVVRSKNDVDGFIVMFRDITKSKSLEEERDEFIAVVSHELRTPITITEGAISNVKLLMERGADKKILTDTLENAHEQTLFLAKMVNDLSTLSRAERGVADAPEIIDVTELLNDLYAQYQSKASDKHLQLDLDVHGKLGAVYASRLYLEEMLQNFITNSIKYTEKGKVTIHAKVSKGVVLFSIQDTGIGISKTDQKRVFEKFYRSEDYRTRETSGTGLGLYVVQKLSHKLGTKVSLTSRLNEGSTFSFTLPITDKQAVTTIDGTH